DHGGGAGEPVGGLVERAGEGRRRVHQRARQPRLLQLREPRLLLLLLLRRRHPRGPRRLLRLGELVTRLATVRRPPPILEAAKCQRLGHTHSSAVGCSTFPFKGCGGRTAAPRVSFKRKSTMSGSTSSEHSCNGLCPVSRRSRNSLPGIF